MKFLITDGKGNFGHAYKKENDKTRAFNIEVRMFSNYDAIEVTNWSTFLIYYEILEEIDV